MTNLKKLLKNKWILLTVCTYLTAACDNHTVYHSYQHIPEQGWKKSDTLFYYIPIEDSASHYQLSIEIRNKDNYPYRNLFMGISHNNTADSTLFVTDTIECILADSNDKWRGDGIGTLFQSEHNQARFFFPHKRNYTFKLFHLMKETPLNGLSDIGIKIQKEYNSK